MTSIRRLERAALLVAAIAFLCLVWLAAKVAHGETARFDTGVRDALHSISTPRLTRVIEALTLLGSSAVLIGVAACASLILLLTGRRDHALLLVIAMAGAEFLLWILKIQFHRQRPEPFFGVVNPESYSFPSGHTLLSFCCYGTLAALARWPVRIAAAALIAGIGISRIYLGVHYPSDVIGGFLVAAVWMAGVAVLFLQIATMKK